MKRLFHIFIWLSLVAVGFAAGAMLGDVRLRTWKSMTHANMRLFSVGIGRVLTALVEDNSHEEFRRFVDELPVELSLVTINGDYDSKWLLGWTNRAKVKRTNLSGESSIEN